MALTDKEFQRLYSHMRTQLGTWLTLWQEIGDYMVPWRNMIIANTTPGTKLTDRIFDSTAPQALTTAASAVHGSVTPDNLRWFSFTVGDEALMQADGVLPWLDLVANMVYGALSNSNFNSEAQELYSDLLAFGTAVMSVEEEKPRANVPFTGFRFHTQQPGTFMLSEGPDGRVDTVLRSYPMTVAALASKWGDAISDNSKRFMEQGRGYEETVTVFHHIAPRTNYISGTLAPNRKRFSSCYYETEGLEAHSNATVGRVHLLQEEGYDEMPVMAPRWRKMSGETYGRSPGMLVLPDVRTLNQAVELRLKAWVLAIAPPIVTPDRGVLGNVRLEPFGRTYVRPGVKIEALNIPSQFDVANFSEDRLQTAIKAGFFVDLLSFQGSQGTPISATEAAIRFQTMQRILGPVVQRLQSEFLAPLIYRCLRIMDRAGVLPLAPPALRGVNPALSLVFEGPLSRVQRAANVDAINQFMSLVLPISEVDPGVLARIDTDGMVDVLQQATAVPAAVIRSREAANQIRAAQQQQQQAAQQQAQLLQAAELFQKGAVNGRPPAAA